MPRGNGITRQEILLSIKSSGSMTAEELARELGISQVAVRQHLSSLEAEGSIAVSIERRGLGRPSHRYMLTAAGDETFPREYDSLANGLLNELRAWQGEAAVKQLLSLRRERMGQTLTSRLRDKSLAARVNELARVETENGYMAEAEQAENGTFTLTKRNCAVCSVARNHPEICCQSEDKMFKNLLGNVEVKLEQSIVEGDHVCSFSIRELPAEAVVAVPVASEAVAA